MLFPEIFKSLSTSKNQFVVRCQCYPRATDLCSRNLKAFCKFSHPLTLLLALQWINGFWHHMNNKGIRYRGNDCSRWKHKVRKGRELKDKKVTECGRKSTDSNKRGADSSVSVRQG